MAKKLGSTEDAGKLRIRIGISTLPAEEDERADKVLIGAGLVAASSKVRFFATLSDGERQVEAVEFKGYAKRKIAISTEAPEGIATVVRIGSDGVLAPAPTRTSAENGESFALFNSMSNGDYVVVRHSAAFSDMVGHWAKDAANGLASRWMLKGTGNGRFEPNREITRSEFASMIVHALGIPTESGSSRFPDVAAYNWYAADVEAAARFGLIEGMSDGTFRPLDKITREQGMSMLSRALTFAGYRAAFAYSAEQAVSPYADAKEVSPWALEGVGESLQAGIFMGRSPDTLAPKAWFTRAEAAASLDRMLRVSGLI